jgi:uncharacterized metal-binding protein YceD (DUF177 family)
MSEFERPYALDALRERPVHHKIAANADECAALAKRFGVLGIGKLEARLVLSRVRAGRAVRVEGKISAALEQACVVSLQPVGQKVSEKFAVLFVPAADLKPVPVDEDGEVDIAALAAEDELEEALPDGPLDLGELVAQEFAVAIDPYPRAEGAQFNAQWGAAAPVVSLPEGKIRPFADLKDKIAKEKEPVRDRKKT